ncbi:MAG TPA: hypothetical protein VK213_09505 [Bacteroidales bacterium]|nr:hypothetical protein [Bacteroidales bacterium]
MRYQASTILLLLLMVSSAMGQMPDTLKNDDFSISIRSIAFIKNNEYFNPIKTSDFIISTGLPWPVDKSDWIEGYTLTGFFLQPELVYTHNKVSLKGGVHLLKYSGETILKARPVFSTSLKISENTVLTIGSLNGSDSHRMYDPHFDKERIYTSYVEDGFQVVTKREDIFNDTWLNWENYIFKGDTEREVFTFGESFRYKSPQIMDEFSIELPLQFQFKHFGGQISDYPEPVTTFFNFAGGARINFDLFNIKTAIEYTGFYNSVFPSREANIINSGNASWLRVHVEKGNFSSVASYWHSRNFFAPNGNGIYSNVYDFSSEYIIPERELITESVFFSLFPEQFLNLLFGVDLYYDVWENRLDHAITLHLDFNKIFSLKSKR